MEFGPEYIINFDFLEKIKGRRLICSLKEFVDPAEPLCLLEEPMHYFTREWQIPQNVST